MDAKIKNFLAKVGVFSTSHSTLECYDPKSVFKYEIKFAVSTDEQKRKNRLDLLHALVHSNQPDDVQCGITLLQGSIPSTSDLNQIKKEIYLLAIGYYKSGEYLKSRNLVDACLEISPQGCKAITLKDMIEDCLKLDEVKGTPNIVASMVGSVARVLSSITILSSYPTYPTYHTWESVDWAVDAYATKLSKKTSNPLEMKEELYLLAHRHYKRGDYSSSRRLISYCLQIEPQWINATALKKSIADRITKRDIDICIGVAATTFCIVVAAAISKKK